MNKDYKYKYYKYKNKYLELRGGLLKRYEHIEIVRDFCDNTNPKYKNCEERNLNTISINDKDEHEFINLKKSIISERNIKNIIRSVDTDDFLNKLKENPEKIRHVLGFFNIEIPYVLSDKCIELGKKEADCGLSVGTVVEKDKINDVFNENIPREKIYNASKGKGKINLNKVVNELKNDGVEYLMLEAAGIKDSRLIVLYKYYGFKVLYNTHLVNLYDDQWLLNENVLMYGNINDIIRLTS